MVTLQNGENSLHIAFVFIATNLFILLRTSSAKL